MKRVVLMGAAVAVLVLVLAAPAEAATAQEIADNIKGIAIGIGASLYTAIVVVVALKFLPGRHYIELGIFLLAAVVVGGIVLLPDSTISTVKDIWRSVNA